MKNYYSILGIASNATEQEIKKAFRALAHRHHPDHNNGQSSAQFIEIEEAYEILSNKERRSKYDHDMTFERYSYRANSENPYFRDAFAKYESDMNRFGHVNRNVREHSDDLDVVITYPTPVSFANLMKSEQEFSFSYRTFEETINEPAAKREFDRNHKFSLNVLSPLHWPKYDFNTNSYYCQIIVNSAGNKRSFTMVIDMAGGVITNVLYGNLVIKIPIDVPNFISLDHDGSIHHNYFISLSEILSGHKFMLETIFGKKGEVALKSYQSLSDIRITVPESGLIGFSGKRMPYHFNLKVKPLDLNNLKEKEKSTLGKLLEKATTSI